MSDPQEAPPLPEFFCDICTGKINIRRHGCVVGPVLFRVHKRFNNRNGLHYIHPTCWTIRLAVKYNYFSRLTWESLPMLPKQQTTPPSGELTCCLCKMNMHGSDGVITFGNCKHGWRHIKCMFVTQNPDNGYHCKLCVDPLAPKRILSSWATPVDSRIIIDDDDSRSQLIHKRFTTVVVPMETSTLPYVREELRDMIERTNGNVALMIATKTPAEKIARCYRENPDGVLKSRHGNPMRDLCAELHSRNLHTLVQPHMSAENFKSFYEKNVHAHVLPFLQFFGYTGADAVTMGLTLEQAMSSSKNISLLLDPDFFTIEALCNSQLGVTFNSLMLAGVPMNEFVAREFTTRELQRLNFNARAFIAACGTTQQWSALITNVSKSDQATVFLATEEIVANLNNSNL